MTKRRMVTLGLALLLLHSVAASGVDGTGSDKTSAAGLIGAALNESGVEGAKRLFEDLLSRRGECEFVEDEFVRLGYKRLRSGRVAEAADVFRMATRAFPKGWSAWNSLGEAMLYTGDKEEALSEDE